MARTPSAEQRAAIEANNPTILVSAAAGSGKTFVLVERIVRLIREGAHLNRMLIMTFTHAAAGEMRERLNERLRDEGLYEALEELEDTQISTIHSFCQATLRREFQAAGVDPAFRVGDSAACRAMWEEAFRLALNALLADEGETDLRALAEAFGTDRLRAAADALYRFLMSMPDPFDWLDRQIALAESTPWDQTAWYRVLRDVAGLQIEGMRACLRTQEEMFREDGAVDAFWEVYLQDLAFVETLEDALPRGEEALRRAMMASGFVRMPPVKRTAPPEQLEWKERYTALRQNVKDLLKDIHEGFLLNPELFHVEHVTDLRFQRGMRALIGRTHELYREIKQRENVIDFSDMEQMTYALLKQPEIRDAVRESLDHIFVDECQDVSGIQDSIIQEVHGERNTLFMVGDVKQSIYRFRLADPTIFLGRMRSFSPLPDAPERRITLGTNYRSTVSILGSANEVFERLMDRRVTELDYTDEERLYPAPAAEEGEPTELCVLSAEPDGDEDEEEEDDRTALEREADAIIERIALLRETPHTVEIDHEKVVVPYRYRDMVILLPKLQGVGRRMAERLQRAGIPVFMDDRGGYFDQVEVQRMLQLLSLLDNPLQDEPLLSACGLPPFAFTEEDLARIRLCAPGRDVPFYEAFAACCEGEDELAERCRAMRETLAGWTFLRDSLPLGDLMRRLLRETGYYAACGAMPRGELRQANLRLLCQHAAEAESIGQGDVRGFLDLVSEMRESGDVTSAKTLGEQEDVVRIMTMHKSKGLQFPVVILAGIGSSRPGGKETVVRFHKDLGITFPYANTEYSIERKTAVWNAFGRRRELDELAERTRLLYVAMTRASERLILIGTAKEKDGAFWSMAPGPYRVWAAGGMLNWVMQTQTPEPTAHWTVDWITSDPFEEEEQAREDGELRDYLSSVLGRPPAGPVFPEASAAGAAPLKTSVTSIAKHRMDARADIAEEEEAADKHEPERITRPLRLGDLPQRPAFMETRAMTAAERGTQTHRVLSLLDLDVFRDAGAEGLADALAKELARLRADGILTGEELGAVNANLLLGYLRSPLGQRMLRSRNVRREWSFNLRVGEDTLLQGVIDCVFLEEGEWVLLDYKTDWIEDEDAFVDRYRDQLNWYRTALETITGVPVREASLFSLRLGKAFPVPREEMRV